MPEQGIPNEAEAATADAAALPVKPAPAPAVDDEPPEPSSPPCYLREFPHQATERM